MPTATVSESASVPRPTGEPRRARRILAVAAVDHPGGAETTLLRLLAGLARPRLGGHAHDARRRPAARRRRVGRLPLVSRSRSAAWPRAPARARSRRGRAPAGWPAVADVVYLNGAVCGRLLPALRRVGARRVLHVHDIVTARPALLAARRRRARGLRRRRRAASRVDAAHVVYGPVDADPPPAAPRRGRPDGAPVVGFVGRIEPRKGPLDLVRAAPAIRAGAPGARVVVVGDDPYGTDPAYTDAVTGSREVEHHPWIDNAPGLMRHLDVLVLPSYEEPFGTVLAEAMAVGTPVVATRVDGLPEVVEDGVTGRLVAPGDPEELAAAVLDVLARP